MISPRITCKNLNHGRANISIGFCPECGRRFNTTASASCGEVKHTGYRKQRFNFCIDCGMTLSQEAARGKR